MSHFGVPGASTLRWWASLPTRSSSIAETSCTIKPRKLCEQFFITLQQDVKDWISLGTTKTGMVYRLKGNPPQSHE